MKKKKNLVLAKFELETETRKKCQDYLYFLNTRPAWHLEDKS